MAVRGLLIALALVTQFAQADVGELRIRALDRTGAVLPGVTVTVESDANQTRRTLVTDAAGQAVVARLPFGTYRLTLALEGFRNDTALVEIRSAVPAERRVTLEIASLVIIDTVALPLIDPRQTTTVQRLGGDTVVHRAAALPGRALPELINTQPGWLLEAGGSVHPRGSENQTQYVVDGLPLTDNRSPGFAPELDADAVQSLGILTGGYPAEYGRKLGGVIEVATVPDAAHGFHGEAAVGGGSFATVAAQAAAGYAGRRGYLGASARASTTDRYLDAPVEENFTNHGESSQATLRAQIGRLGVIASHAESRFEVPNEIAQQEAGQLQRRRGDETAAKLSYQRILSTASVFNVNGMLRDLDAGLDSNDASTPIAAAQQRGVREGYVKASLAWHAGRHEWKFGGDTVVGRLHEQFAYRIADPGAFAPGILPAFSFAGKATDREHALFVQDQISAGDWTMKAGLRWDAYRLLVDESAFSPRVSAAWAPTETFVVRASYDRAFQTPATENLLLASSAEVDTLAPSVIRLPVRPSRGNFFETGASRLLGRGVRLDGSWFDRRMDNFADDDLLLNTGVSFPIAFRRGAVHGVELKLDVPQTRTLSGSVSYSWMRGEAELPVTGGLFLGDEVDLGTPGERVTITQDQRHTLRGRVSARLPRRAWTALSGALDSGLPFESSETLSAAEVSPRVLAQVNFETGRVRPSWTLDAAAGWVISERGGKKIEVQADVRNLTNALRVINFAGVFSGTALAPPRAWAARVRFEF